MVEKTQQSRFSKSEMELLKNELANEKGEDILYAVRDVLFQFSNTPPTLTKEILKIIRKAILPTPEQDIPLGFQQDVYSTLSHIKEIDPSVAILHIQAKNLFVDYLEQRMTILEGGVVSDPIILSEMKSPIGKSNEDLFVSMMAYLLLINAYIDSMVVGIKALANQKEETPEEKSERLKKDSSK